MRFYLTGHKGLLGNLIKNYSNDNAIPLKFNSYKKEIYPQLSINGEELDIVHCGATLNLNFDKNILYKKNFLSTKQIVDYLACQKQSRLIYVSANSIGNKEVLNKGNYPKDKYNLFKYKSENYIRKRLKPSRFIIIRLPGLYRRGVVGSGFLDKLIYSEDEIFYIKSNHIFNNIALASDIAKYLISLLNLDTFPGYLGNIGSQNPIYLKDLITKLILIRPEIENRIKFINSKIINEGIDYTMAMKYGFQAKDTLFLAKSLYEKNC